MAMRDHLDRFGKDGIPALCSGHRRTWAAFAAAAIPLIRAVAGRVLAIRGQGDEALPDAVQNVFVRLCADDFRLLRSYDATRASLSTWLAMVSWSCAIDLVRRRRIALVVLDTVPEAALAIEDRHFERLRIPATLLTDRQAKVVQLLYGEDREVAEVATSLHVDRKVIYKIHDKALQRLRTHFKATDG
jgi:RNA polymerase sigma factor (sigma-70 family)